MTDEHTVLEKVVEHWEIIVGGGSTLVGVVAMVRYRLKQHYLNPHVRMADMNKCKKDLAGGIEENKKAIICVEQQIADGFRKHNESDRVRYENLLMTMASMQNGRN